MQLIMSLVEIVTLIAILFSSNRRAIRLRTVGGAFLIQIGLGCLRSLFRRWSRGASCGF